MHNKNKKLFELLLAAERENVECRENPDLFYPEDWDYLASSQLDHGVGSPTAMSHKARRLAKEMCLRCPIKEQCLDYALEAKEMSGIWGGLTYRERLELKQKTR